MRHHLEWRARAPDLEALDRAVEANYARHDGDPFDPLFYRDGEAVAPGVYRVEDDYFLEQTVGDLAAPVTFGWHGRSYRCLLPPDATLPAFLEVEGLADPPPGALHVVLRRPAGLFRFFRPPAPPFVAAVEAVAAPG